MLLLSYGAAGFACIQTLRLRLSLLGLPLLPCQQLLTEGVGLGLQHAYILIMDEMMLPLLPCQRLLTWDVRLGLQHAYVLIMDEMMLPLSPYQQLLT